MKDYEVTYTIVGRASVTIRANSKEEAKKLAMDYEYSPWDEKVLEFELDTVESIEEC